MQFFADVKKGWRLSFKAIGITLNNKKLLIYGASILFSWLILLSLTIAGLLFFYRNSFANASDIDRAQLMRGFAMSHLPFIVPIILIFLSLLIYNFFYSSLVRSIVSIENKPIIIIESLKQTTSIIPTLLLFTIIHATAIAFSMLYLNTFAVGALALVIIMFFTLISMTLTISNPVIAIGKAAQCAFKNIGYIAGVNAAIGTMIVAGSLTYVILNALSLSFLIKINTLVTIATALLLGGSFLIAFIIITTAMTMSYTTIYIDHEKKNIPVSATHVVSSGN